mmetsp:Transcript_37105/g.110768  ORF Transcript_37105/g.110768 Transcript_37105/m.110768 type:complete len:414 (+) Transcript_37105:212-1453(+)
MPAPGLLAGTVPMQTVAMCASPPAGATLSACSSWWPGSISSMPPHTRRLGGTSGRAGRGVPAGLPPMSGAPAPSARGELARAPSPGGSAPPDAPRPTGRPAAQGDRAERCEASPAACSCAWQDPVGADGTLDRYASPSGQHRTLLSAMLLEKPRGLTTSLYSSSSSICPPSRGPCRSCITCRTSVRLPPPRWTWSLARPLGSPPPSRRQAPTPSSRVQSTPPGRNSIQPAGAPAAQAQRWRPGPARQGPSSRNSASACACGSGTAQPSRSCASSRRPPQQKRQRQRLSMGSRMPLGSWTPHGLQRCASTPFMASRRLSSPQAALQSFSAASRVLSSRPTPSAGGTPSPLPPSPPPRRPSCPAAPGSRCSSDSQSRGRMLRHRAPDGASAPPSARGTGTKSGGISIQVPPQKEV